MAGSEESDEPEVSSHALHGLLADLNTPSTSRLPISQSSSWAFPPLPSRSSPSIYGAGQPPVPVRRTSSREQPRSTAELDLVAAQTSVAQPSTLFNTPSRSIFSSGPPTSSLSQNTAQASMSAPLTVTSPHPLSVLTSPGSNALRRSSNQQLESQPSSARKARIARAEKDVDDPSISMEDSRLSDRRGNNSTPTALSRLFAAPAMGSLSGIPLSRAPSGVQYMRSMSETAPLPNHLYSRGLISGRHSDITVHAFGTKYALHRLLLDRAPFFSSALSEPWFESSSRDITLHPEDIDTNITQAAFELALRRIYGCHDPEEEDKEAMGLFATACWLDMADVIESSIMSLLRQMCPAKLAPMIRFVTSNYYGKAGDRVLGSAKAMLCREGWEMPLKCWDDVPGDIVREIIGGDGFYVPGEWERFILAKRVLDRRLKARAIEAGLVELDGKVKKVPSDSMNLQAIRFDTVYRMNASSSTRGMPGAYDAWLGLYTSPNIAALLVLLDEGIHYIHLSFEHLQKIREQRDILGLPLMPEKVISNALWMSMELRQKIVNSRELDMELDISQRSEEAAAEAQAHAENALRASSSGTNLSETAAGKQVQKEASEVGDDEMESGSWDGNGKPRKFWIPHIDATYPMGGNPEAVLAAHNVRPTMNRHMSRLSASLDPQDVQWASDFASGAQERPHTPHRSVATEPSPQISYTHYPPFRFAAEFPNPRALKEKKRVYSLTVWYAGSLWNVYVQKIETPKNTQLGVYLHRERHREGSEETIANGYFNTVDERIGHLEREMLMRRTGTRPRQQPSSESRTFTEDETSGSGGDPDATLIPTSSIDSEPRRQATALSGLLRSHNQSQSVTKASETPATLTLSSLPDRAFGAGTGTPDSDDEVDNLTSSAAANGRKLKVSALPPYVDGRPTIKTYFKIYTPSKGGRMLSVYESAPDKFNFSQSWGWKSSNMVLDDGVMGYDEGLRGKEGKLRFMVVIGNV